MLKRITLSLFLLIGVFASTEYALAETVYYQPVSDVFEIITLGSGIERFNLVGTFTTTQDLIITTESSASFTVENISCLSWDTPSNVPLIKIASSTSAYPSTVSGFGGGLVEASNFAGNELAIGAGQTMVVPGVSIAHPVLYAGTEYAVYLASNCTSGQQVGIYGTGSFSFSGFIITEGLFGQVPQDYGVFNTGFLLTTPQADAVTSTNTVDLYAEFVNGVPALDSSWQVCLDFVAVAVASSTPYGGVLCQDINASGVNIFSTTTSMAFGINNLLWYAYDTVNDQKRFALSYNIDVGGFGVDFDFFNPDLPTTESEASSTVVSFEGRVTALRQILNKKWPINWVTEYSILLFDLTTDQNLVATTVPSFAIDFSGNQTLQNIATTTDFDWEIEIFSSSTLAEVGAIGGIQMMRRLVGWVLWIGLMGFAYRSVVGMFKT